MLPITRKQHKACSRYTKAQVEGFPTELRGGAPPLIRRLRGVGLGVLDKGSQLYLDRFPSLTKNILEQIRQFVND